MLGIPRKTVGILALAVLGAALAGCLGGDSLEEPGPVEAPVDDHDSKELRLKPAQANDLERFFEAIQVVPADDPDWDRPNVTKRDWIFLSAPLTPAGSVVAYKFEFPRDALSLDLDAGAPGLVLDVAIALSPMGFPAELPVGMDWMFIAASETYNEQSSIWQSTVGNSQMSFGATQTIVKQESGSSGTPQTEPARSAPFTIHVPYHEDITGDTVHLILAARGSGGTFGVGVRMTEPVGPHATDWADFHDLTMGRKPFVPERTVTGEGLHLALYDETRDSASATSIYSVDAGAPEEGLPKDLYPLVATRDLGLTSSTAWGGWSDMGLSYASGIETGMLDVQGSVHGTEVSRTFYFLGHAGVIPEQVIPDGFFPPPVVRLTVEGAAASDLELQLTKTGAIGLERFVFRHVSMGVQIEEVTGLPFRELVIIS